MNQSVCEHGSLARSCVVCELIHEAAVLTEQLRQMTAAFNAQENVLIDQQKLTQALRDLYRAELRKRGV